MGFLEYLLIIIFILALILIWASITYNKIQDIVIKLNEAEKNIDNILRERYDMLVRAKNIIEETITKKGLFKDLEDLKDKKLSNFEFERYLCDYVNEFHDLKNDDESFKSNESIMKLDFTLEESEEQLEAYINYYNDNITIYNTLIKKIPSNIIAKFNKLKPKKFFDNKNMNDKDIKDFKA